MWMLLYNADPERGLSQCDPDFFGRQAVAWLGDMNIVLAGSLRCSDVEILRLLHAVVFDGTPKYSG